MLRAGRLRPSIRIHLPVTEPDSFPYRNPNTQMTTHCYPIAVGRLLGLTALLAGSLSAQTTAPNPSSSSSPTETPDDVITLSPFVVSATQDTGYQASSTLAGTRLSTPVKDLGASISIYTRDFLNDIGATMPERFAPDGR